MCHQESGYIQELAQEVAMQKSQNIWVDGSLRNGDWFVNVYDDIRHRYPRYKIAIFYVYAFVCPLRFYPFAGGIEQHVPHLEGVGARAVQYQHLSVVTGL